MLHLSQCKTSNTLAVQCLITTQMLQKELSLFLLFHQVFTFIALPPLAWSNLTRAHRALAASWGLNLEANSLTLWANLLMVPPSNLPPNLAKPHRASVRDLGSKLPTCPAIALPNDAITPAHSQHSYGEFTSCTCNQSHVHYTKKSMRQWLSGCLLCQNNLTSLEMYATPRC